MSNLTLEVGSSYSTASGRIFFIDRTITEAEPLFHQGFRFVAKSGNLFLSYTPSGRCYLNKASYLDLVKQEKVIKLEIGKKYLTRSGNLVKITEKATPSFIRNRIKKEFKNSTGKDLNIVKSDYFRQPSLFQIKVITLYDADTGRVFKNDWSDDPLDIISEADEVTQSKPSLIDYTEPSSDLTTAQINPIQFVSPITEQLFVDITHKQKPFVLVVKQNDKIISTITVNPDGSIVTA